jgi:signal transduction histidine kinase/DNA-binding response OmpR family regulator
MLTYHLPSPNLLAPEIAQNKIAKNRPDHSGINAPENQPQKIELEELAPTAKTDPNNPQDLLGYSREPLAAKINPGNHPVATILIVDDTPNNLQILFSSLETAGFKVLLAEDSHSALSIAQTQNPDLILLDVLMPGVDGFATCSQLKSQGATKDIPVIFLTALSDTINKVQGFKLGGVDYITKPIEQEEVLVRIQTHLNLRNMGRALAQQNRELQQALDFEALVRRITDKVRDSLDETHCLRVATEELATVLHLSGCQIELYDPQQQTATIAHEYSLTLPLCQGETRQIDDFPELYQQLLQKAPLQLVEPVPLFNPQGIQVTRLACPIFDDRGIIGNLWGLRPPGELFNDLEIRLMQQVASQCAIAMRQARLYASSNQQVAELAKLNQLKDDFLKTVSHELKAPISSIQLAAQTLESLLKAKQNPQNSPLFQRVLKIFHESCQQQKKLTDDLLTLCYIDAQAKVIQPESIELNAFLSNLTKPYLVTPNLQQRPKLLVKLSRQQPKIYGDPMILERIVQELLNHALQHSTVEGKITLKTKIIPDQVLIQVIDPDRELPEAEQQLVFGQFYRGQGAVPQPNRSTGLGLTLVKKLVEILQADIAVSSDRQGTIFTVTLPLESN